MCDHAGRRFSVHVDAALAGSAMILPECRALWRGIDQRARVPLDGDHGRQVVEEPAVGTPDETAARWHRLFDGAWCPVAGDGVW